MAELVRASSQIPVEGVVPGRDGRDLVPSSPEAKEKVGGFSVDISLTGGKNEVEPLVSPIVGEVTDGVVISGDTEETGEEDPGPALLRVTDDSDKRPLCLPAVVASEEMGAPGVLGVKGKGERHLAPKLVPRSMVVFLWSEV